MMGILPIFIILIIIIFIILIMTKVLKTNVNKRGKYIYSNRVRWVLGGYIGILLISAGLITFLPTDEMSKMKIAPTSDLEKENTDLYNAAINGKIDNIDPKYIDKKWSLNYDDPQLEVVVDENLNIQIIVERKIKNDDKIEAVMYKTRSNMNDRDITSLTNLPSVKLGRNQLMIIKPNLAKIEISEFKNVFSIRQFSGEKIFSHHTGFFEGQSILYLQIPKDLELVDKTNLYIQFVD
jgi:hypothetical protein